MKKIFIPLIAASLLSASSLSMPVYDNEDEFQRMSRIMDSMLQRHYMDVRMPSFSSPKANFRDTKRAYIYEFDLAGVPKENIKLTISDKNILVLEGKKESNIKNEKEGYIRQEIFYGNFKRVIQLPEDADQDKLQTKYDNGILTLSIPKKELKKAKARVIEIK